MTNMSEAESVERLKAEIERLQARLAVKCEHPSAESCASLWQADTNQRQLASVDPALCDEFQWGADTCEKLAEALVAARESRDKAHRLLREAILRDGIVDDRWFEEAENAT